MRDRSSFRKYPVQRNYGRGLGFTSRPLQDPNSIGRLDRGRKEGNSGRGTISFGGCDVSGDLALLPAARRQWTHAGRTTHVICPSILVFIDFRSIPIVDHSRYSTSSPPSKILLLLLTILSNILIQIQTQPFLRLGTPLFQLSLMYWFFKEPLDYPSRQISLKIRKKHPQKYWRYLG